MEIKDLADHALEFFESRERPRKKPAEEPERFWVLKDVHPVWIKEMLFEVHDRGRWFPDDYKYEYVVDALEKLREGMDPEEPELEADIYNSDLIGWLASHLERAGYVDEAAENMGHSTQGIFGDIGQGQWYEREEVFRRVAGALQERLEGIGQGVPEKMERGDKPLGPKEWSPHWRPREE